VFYYVNQETVSATSGYIRVFDADLTFEGGDPDPECNVEAETGFFMALGPERKLLSLHLQPADPKAVFPEGFQYWWEHLPEQEPPPPYTVAAGGGYPCVDFYSALTGGEPLTSDQLSWGYKEMEPYGFVEVPTPAQLYVQAKAVGTCTISLGMDYNTHGWCWPEDPTSAGDTVKLTVVAADLNIQDVPEWQEEEPGGFVALGGSRKKIMLSVLPSTVGPVTFSVAPDSRVEIYAAQVGGEPLGIPRVYQTAADVPTELWVKGVGVSGELHDVVLTLDAEAGGQHFTDTVKFTVLAIESVVWEAIDSPLTDNAPAPGGGKRIYPGKQAPTDPVDRTKVRVKAKIKPGCQWQRIRFRSFDVDDPSAEGIPIDNPAYEKDNRGTPREGYLAADFTDTDASGYANVDFTVTMKPGDNFRVVAYHNDVSAGGLHAQQNDGTNARVFWGSTPVSDDDTPDCIKATPLLTVWRKLHVECDDMGAPEACWIFDPPITGTSSSLTETVLTDNQAHWLPYGQLIGAEVDPNKQDSWPDAYVVTGSSETTVTTAGGMLAHANAGDPYSINTDDVDPGDVAAPDTGLMAEAFAAAYVTVVYDTGNDTHNCVFLRNPVDATLEEQGSDYRGTTTEEVAYWSAYLQAGYEYATDHDNDPEDLIEAYLGVSTPSEPEYAFVFKETIRDLCDDTGWPAVLVEQRTCVHEVGHQFLGPGHHDGCVMCECVDPALQTSFFCPNCLAAIRLIGYP
jgi:hypothetical protein